MFRFILHRLGMAVPTLLLISVIVFALIRLIPGDPALLMLGDMADPQSLADMRSSLGLDHSVVSQYLIWIKSVLSGDLGVSISSRQPVLELLIERFSVSATVVLVSVLLATLLAVPVGLLAAWKQNSVMDLGLVATATLLLSVPSFWLGLLLLYVFGIQLGWLPVIGYVGFASDPLKAVTYVVLPIITLTLVEFGAIARMARASTIEVLRLEYIAHARAKGLSESAVLWNTEVGVLVDSPQLAAEARRLALQGMSPALSYEPKLDQGKIVWVTEDNGRLHALSHEPGNWWRRLNAWFSKSVGLEKML